MGIKAKVDYSFSAAESKWDVETHKYSGAEGVDLGKHVVEIALQPYPGNTKTFEIVICLKRAGLSAEILAETAKGLLDQGGFKQVELQTRDGASSFNLSIANASAGDLLKIVSALATNAPKGRSDTHFALLDKGIAGEIIESELKRLKLSPTAAGLVQINTDTMSLERMKMLGMEKPVSYIDVNLSGYVASPVSSMREDGYPASEFSKNIMYVETFLTLNDQNPAAVRKALQDAHIKISDLKGNMICAAAPVDLVAGVLSKAGVLPKSVTDEISTKAENGHQSQRQINAEAEAPHKKPVISVLKR